MPTPSQTTHSPLSTLIRDFLKSAIDSYNSTDLTLTTPSADADTLGERARLCLNQALHIIYALIKDSRYLEAYPTTAFSSVASQAYILLDPEPYLDDIESVTETTNNVRLKQKSWSWYRRNFPDPSESTGTPAYYIRRGDRLYLAPTPSSVINYTVDFRKHTAELALNGDLPLLPTPYNFWIYAEALVIWYQMEDPTSVPQLIITERDSKRLIAMDSIMTSYDQSFQAESNCERSGLGMMPWTIDE